MRCGDTVKHLPSGETWTVAYVDGDYLAWVGWPCGTARVGDCEIIERCTDAEHVNLLKRLCDRTAADSWDRRPTMARRALEAFTLTLSDDLRQALLGRLTAEWEAAQKECARAHGILADATERQRRLEGLRYAMVLEIVDHAYPHTDEAA